MKKSFFKVMAAAIIGAAALNSCSGGNQPPETEYIPVKLEKNEGWGIVKIDGEMIYKDEFSEAPRCIAEGAFCVPENGGYTLYQLGPKPKAIPNCEGLADAGMFNGGLAPVVRKGQRISVVDKDGNTKFVLEPIGGKEVETAANCFADGMLTVRNEDGKWGAVGTDGKVALKCDYDFLVCLQGIIIAVADDKAKVIDKKGQTIFKLKDDQQIMMADGNGILVRNEDGRYGFYTKDGVYTKASASVDGITEFNDKYYIFNDEDGNCGVMERKKDKDEKLIRAKYQSLTMIDGGKRFFGEANDKYVIVDPNGDETKVFDDYSSVELINAQKGVFIGKEGSRYILLDINGKPLNKDEYYEFARPENLSTGYVRSDFTNIDGIISATLSMISTDNIYGIKIGAPAQDYAKEPETYSYSFTPDKETPKGFGYTTAVEGITDGSIGLYDYETGQTRFNPLAKVCRVDLYVNANVSDWDDIKDKLYEGITAKGFSKTDENQFESDGIVLIVNPGSTFIITLIDKTALGDAPIEYPDF